MFVITSNSSFGSDKIRHDINIKIFFNASNVICIDYIYSIDFRLSYICHVAAEYHVMAMTKSWQELAGVGRSWLAGIGRSWQELVGRSWQELAGVGWQELAGVGRSWLELIDSVSE